MLLFNCLPHRVHSLQETDTGAEASRQKCHHFFALLGLGRNTAKYHQDGKRQSGHQEEYDDFVLIGFLGHISV